ncbi:Rv2175c family DNA-binding protein [Microvirga arsenatis]|uniref:Rv2175c C-terminal domain-containing protein n=1 Tax=Microvirga arsenatis TaxID=2692265 RepID=A0ABW9Z8E2_9HYPH|nr:Rv2175c family DNA-binding protein [Microvirga arsenatis]NBJ13679.1 hypothetical protein [Microvirga arsenatis]NBJ27171.1 hypothetical protein [Microvirga arsenatis]
MAALVNASRTKKPDRLKDIGTRTAGFVVTELRSHTELSAELARVIEGIGQVLERAIEISGEPQKLALLSRAVKGFDAAINAPVNSADLVSILSSSTDVGALAKALTAAASDPVVAKLDPTAELVAAGAARKAELINLAGGLFSLQNVVSLLKITRQAIEKRRKAGTIIAVRTGDDYRYPACQFTQDGMVEGLDMVLKEMPVRADWMRLEWLLTPDEALDGLSPLEALKKGQLEDVLDVARAQGAE